VAWRVQAIDVAGVPCARFGRRPVPRRPGSRWRLHRLGTAVSVECRVGRGI